MTTNLARGKPTSQSSTYKEGTSTKAVDGKKTNTIREKSCSRTSPGREGSWWQVDLESVYEIRQVVIINGGQLKMCIWEYYYQINMGCGYP